MRIALDYDETITLDLVFWSGFVKASLDRGHEVRIVTLRSEDIDKIGEYEHGMLWGIPVIYCSHRPKRVVCHEAGWMPDVWIDDSPEVIAGGGTWTAERIEEWRKERDAGLGR